MGFGFWVNIGEKGVIVEFKDFRMKIRKMELILFEIRKVVGEEGFGEFGVEYDEFKMLGRFLMLGLEEIFELKI